MTEDTQEKAFVCQFEGCGKRFDTAQQLRGHKGVHTRAAKAAKKLEKTDANPATKPAEKRVKSFKCVVLRHNIDPENANLPVIVTANNFSNRKQFTPGTEVILTETEIDILKNSVEEDQIQIMPDSGIYKSRDPLALASELYAGFQPVRDPNSGQINMIRNVANYSVHVINEV